MLPWSTSEDFIDKLKASLAFVSRQIPPLSTSPAVSPPVDNGPVPSIVSLTPAPATNSKSLVP